MADPKFDTRMANKTVLSNVENWARNNGFQHLTMVTHRNEMAMLRRWGFDTYKHIMRKAL
jgi:N-acyl-L-homoserine lactone synthetase